MTFQSFWPIYLAEHRHPLNRALHLVGTLTYLTLLSALLMTGHAAWAWTVPVLAYGFAWFGHFAVEKNRPATFQHPWLSLIGDHKMALYMLSGRLQGEFERLGIRARP